MTSAQYQQKALEKLNAGRNEQAAVLASLAATAAFEEQSKLNRANIWMHKGNQFESRTAQV